MSKYNRSRNNLKNEISITLLGSKSVGKTSLAKLCKSNVTNIDFDTYRPTTSDIYSCKVWINQEVNNGNNNGNNNNNDMNNMNNYNYERVCYRVKIIDTEGLTNDADISDSQYFEQDGFMLVYSIDNYESFETVKNAYESLIEKADVEDSPPIILIGNKEDLNNDRQINKEEGENLKLNSDGTIIDFKEISAKTLYKQKQQNIQSPTPNCFEILVHNIVSNMPQHMQYLYQDGNVKQQQYNRQQQTNKNQQQQQNSDNTRLNSMNNNGNSELQNNQYSQQQQQNQGNNNSNNYNTQEKQEKDNRNYPENNNNNNPPRFMNDGNPVSNQSSGDNNIRPDRRGNNSNMGMGYPIPGNNKKRNPQRPSQSNRSRPPIRPYDNNMYNNPQNNDNNQGEYRECKIS